MKNFDNNSAVAITRDIYWIGFYEESSKLHCNPYIMIDSEDVVLFDPGSIPDFPLVMRKVIDLVNPQDVSLIITSHQDPDVCGNLAVVEDVVEHDDIRIAAHINTLRLIQHLGLKSKFYAVNQNDNQISLKSGRILEFVPVPFLHAPGAIMTYDRKTRSLFSGDVFGAIDDHWSLFADKGFPENMKAFHQAYMPTNAILRPAMERLQTMDIDCILPQHGSVIEGDRVEVAIDYLKNLPCGIDLAED
ncbi:MAG: MBL fold metallo-hydrolase [Pseudomonadota bacterium]